MDFRTKVTIPRPGFQIEPFEEMLFVGSCFADAIGRRFQEDKFRATVNPFGVMYNPVSIMHTVERYNDAPRVAVLTLGTNHVYRLRSTGAIVDNCQKQPARLFSEEELTLDECFDCLAKTVELLASRRADTSVVITVSPIRYAKYGYHGSQLSKAVLLLAADRLVATFPNRCYYFPAYELLLDELRDYRFYQPDMLHPTAQAADYVYECFAAACFSDRARQFVDEWRPLKQAFAHRPFHPESEEYRHFLLQTKEKAAALEKKYTEPPVNS